MKTQLGTCPTAPLSLCQFLLAQHNPLEPPGLNFYGIFLNIVFKKKRQMEIDIAKTGRSVVTVSCTLRHKPNILLLINAFLSIANELSWKNKRTSHGNKLKNLLMGM